MTDAPTGNAMPARLLIGLALGLGWALFWYWDSYTGIVSLWNNSDTYTHGYVILPMVAWLIWQDRAKLSGTTVKPTLAVILPAISSPLAGCSAKSPRSMPSPNSAPSVWPSC